MEVIGGQLTQTSGNPVWPCTLFTGPVLSGNVFNGTGTGGLAAVGEQIGSMANVGFCEMVQASLFFQPASGAASNAYATQIVLPAQSMITSISAIIKTVWDTNTTFTVGTAASSSLFQTSTASGATAGVVAITTGTGSGPIGAWINTGSSDLQVVVTSSGTSSGASNNGEGVLYIRYIQGVNIVA